MRLHKSTNRWMVLVLHRRAGKTVATINHLIRDACINKGSKYAYIAPTYRQAKDIAWDMLKKYARPIPDVLFNESELRVDFPNGSRIRLYGADNPDSLRGLSLWGVVFDEYSQQPSNIFTEIIRPALADNKGYAIWIGTPKGKNDFFRLYEYGMKQADWLALCLTVEDTKLIDDEELADAKKLMSEDEYNQEWMCSFEAAIKGAYYARQIATARAEHRITSVPYDPQLPVYTFWDIGIGDSTAISFVQVLRREIRMIDYYENSGEGLPHYVKVLQDKGYVYATHHGPHDIAVREFGTGKTRVETAAALGVRFVVGKSLGIEDGIEAFRLAWSRLWIDETKCAFFIDAVSQYQKEWDDKHGCFKEKPLHNWTSHAADCGRYMAVAMRDSFSVIKEKDDFKPRRRQKHRSSMRMA